jgi:predicted molibdopterin-dependent oxidoreductase YjgC
VCSSDLREKTKPKPDTARVLVVYSCTMNDEIDQGYVLSCNGMRTTLSYQGGCWERSEFLGIVADDDEARAAIKAHIRRNFEMRNGCPVYVVSDHGNIHRRRAIRLRVR